MKKKQTSVRKQTGKKTSARKKKFSFTKMVASGNDFIVCDNRRRVFQDGGAIARQLCPRTEGIGADGLIFIEPSKRADFRMRIFNADGSEAEMCGNGLRCAVLLRGRKKVTVETLAGRHNGEINDALVKVNMTEPRDIRLNVNIDIDGRVYALNYINTGVPHAVHFVQDLEAVNVRLLGRLIRYHKEFEPQGTNVDFVIAPEPEVLHVRTYERGVEAETLACGTGSVASALVYHQHFVGREGTFLSQIHTRGGEVLTVYFDYEKGRFSNVSLEGAARIVYQGECYV